MQATTSAQQNTSGTGTTATLAFPSNVPPRILLSLRFTFSHPQSLMISDNQSDSFVQIGSAVSAGQFTLYVYRVASAVGGATTISVSGGGNTGTYIMAAELQDITGVDTGGSSHNTNFTQNSASSFFSTGGVTTTNALDFIISIAICGCICIPRTERRSCATSHQFFRDNRRPRRFFCQQHRHIQCHDRH